MVGSSTATNGCQEQEEGSGDGVSSDKAEKEVDAEASMMLTDFI
jgi:hypothetical protein